MGVLEQILDDDRTISESHIYSYKESFTGFAAKLTGQERKKLEGMDDVLAVWPSTEFELQTTRSWDFIQFPIDVARSQSNSQNNLIVGVLDSGIWPDSESFKDDGFGPPAAKWKGACQTITCNNKIIGARPYYTGSIPLAEEKSVIDIDGHGTHTASTAAGVEVKNVSFYGLAEGTARGGSPSARIAVYKVCWKTVTRRTCMEHDILAALEDAMTDGVDVISASIGRAATPSYGRDAFAIGSFRAMKKGILVSAAAGNYGPGHLTVTNGAPWILTVAATTTDRKFQGETELGNNQSLIGNIINGFPSQEPFYPLVLGENINRTTKSASGNDTKGKNAVTYVTIKDVDELRSSGAEGIIAISDKCEHQSVQFPLPSVCLTSSDGEKLMDYVSQNNNPVGKILKSRGTLDSMAPTVARFSSRGPNAASPDILKPDIGAPGVQILAAWSPKASPTAPFSGDTRSSAYNIISGTSMACPHVSGIALYVKSFHPSWSPAAIKSALMTTATPIGPEKDPDAELGYGAGQVNPIQAINPGLIYDASENDYIKFLCANGYTEETIKQITGDNSITCSDAKNITTRDLNYPSMSARVDLKDPFRVEFKRTVTNVGVSDSIYKVDVQAPLEFNVTVNPEVLSFKSLGEKIEFTTTIYGGPLQRGVKASMELVWSDGKHSVRSPILVYNF